MAGPCFETIQVLLYLISLIRFTVPNRANYYSPNKTILATTLVLEEEEVIIFILM